MDINVSDCSFAFGRQIVLRNVFLEVPTGKCIGVVGGNGSGKSTLLRLIAGLYRPASGHVAIGGQDLRGRTGMHRLVGSAIDVPAFYPWMSAEGVLRTLVDLAGERDGGRIGSALDVFELTGLARKRATRLSTGMQKRLQLACAVLFDPPVLLLDEPSNGLDGQARERLETWLESLAHSCKTVVITSHRESDLRHCNTKYEITEGALRAVDLE